MPARRGISSLLADAGRAPSAAVSVGPEGPLHEISAHAAGVADVAHREADLLSQHPAVCDGYAIPTGIESTGDYLVRLREPESALRELPFAFDAGRHDPEKSRAVVGTAGAGRHLNGLIGPPISHREGIRHDSGPRFEGEELWTQLEVEVGQQEHRDDGPLREVCLKDIRGDEVGPVADAFPHS